MLCDKGADIMALNNEGYSALHYACASPEDEVRRAFLVGPIKYLDLHSIGGECTAFVSKWSECE